MKFLQHSPQYNQNQIFKNNKDLLWCVLRESTKSIFKTVYQVNLYIITSVLNVNYNITVIVI